MSDRHSVIVLGAGMAGISAAERLVANGYNDVIVLEARDRIGGRVYVRELDGNRIHMGAQWIHQYCPENPLVQVAKKYEMVDDDTPITGGDMNPDDHADTDNVYSSAGFHIPPEQVKLGIEIFKKICKLVEGEEESDLIDEVENVNDLYDVVAEAELKKLEDALGGEELEMVSGTVYGYKNALAHYICGPLDDCSVEVYATGETLPGDDVDLPYDLLAAMAADLPAGCVKLEHVVTKVDWSSESEIKVTCQLENSQNKVFKAKHVICTLPIGVLQAHHESLFTPNLPNWKVQAIHNISAGGTNKYFVAWDNPWRPVNDTPFVLAWRKEELGNINFPEEWYKGIMEISAENPQGSLMCAWIGGRATQFADTLPDDQILRDIGSVLRNFSGNPDIPDPDHLVRECWTCDPYTLGAYSYPKVDAKPGF